MRQRPKFIAESVPKIQNYGLIPYSWIQVIINSPLPNSSLQRQWPSSDCNCIQDRNVRLVERKRCGSRIRNIRDRQILSKTECMKVLNQFHINWYRPSFWALVSCWRYLAPKDREQKLTFSWKAKRRLLGRNCLACRFPSSSLSERWTEISRSQWS